MRAIVTMLFALPVVLSASTHQANASTLHLCPVPNYVSGTVSTSGDSPWTIHLPKGNAEMFVSGETIYCKLDGLLLTKDVPSKNCVLGAEAGKITKSPRSTYCTFSDELGRKANDCYVVCP
jgi:hypothetical protein